MAQSAGGQSVCEQSDGRVENHCDTFRKSQYHIEMRVSPRVEWKVLLYAGDAGDFALYCFFSPSLTPATSTDSTQTIKGVLEDGPLSRIWDCVAPDKMSNGIEETSRDGTLAPCKPFSFAKTKIASGRSAVLCFGLCSRARRRLMNSGVPLRVPKMSKVSENIPVCRGFSETLRDHCGY